MNLQQALAVLAREKHNGHARWDGTCPPGNPAWRTEFEVIAIAEAYERMREPDPCATLRARLESVAAALRELAAATGMVDTAYRKLRIVEDAAGIDYSMPVSEFDRLGKAIVGLRSVRAIRR